MGLDGVKLNNFLKISLVVLNLFITNVIMVTFSVLSLGILTPALVGATYCEIENIYSYDLNGVFKRYFLNFKNKLKLTLGKLLIINFFIIIICLNMLIFNRISANQYNPIFYYFILFTQIVMLFEMFNVLQISLIQIFVFDLENINKVLLNSFLIINTNIIKILLGNLSIVISLFLINKLPIFILVFIAINVTLYYISTKRIVKSFLLKYQLI